jgi:hypothetical protein
MRIKKYYIIIDHKYIPKKRKKVPILNFLKTHYDIENGLLAPRLRGLITSSIREKEIEMLESHVMKMKKRSQPTSVAQANVELLELHEMQIYIIENSK